MTSLVPGPLFGTPGLNRNSTPSPNNTTPRELEQRYGRGEFNGHPWPHDSPVNRVYDVKNTSTKLIILNNKYGQNGTRLRGYYTGPGVRKTDRRVNPQRHERVSSPVSADLHERCLDSSSPRFEPSIKANIEWTNQSQRPPNSLTVKYTVNPQRHARCQAQQRDTADYYTSDSRPVSRMSHLPKRYYTDYPELTVGEKIYLWSIEKIYNIDHMKKQKEEQYRKLLDMEAKKGYHGYDEYAKYMRYIHSASKRTYGMSSPGIHRNGGVSKSTTPRTRSAFSHRGSGDASINSTSKNGSVKDEETEKSPVRPQTTIGRTRTPAATKITRTKSAKSEGQTPAKSKSKSKQRSKSANQISPYLQPRVKSVPALKLRSKPSRPTSQKRPKQSKETEDNSETSSLTDKGDVEPSLQKEGRDRPKSRLGHPKQSKETEDNSETSSLTDKGEVAPSLHKEGRDRPKSRLGHPPKDKVDRKPNYKDDEYSDHESDSDETSTPKSTADEQKKDTAHVDDKTPAPTVDEHVNAVDEGRDTTESDYTALNKKPKDGDEYVAVTDETDTQQSDSVSYSQSENNEQVLEPVADEATQDTSRDNLPFTKTGSVKDNEDTETDVIEKNRDHDTGSIASSVRSTKSFNGIPAEVETPRSDIQEHVEITTKKRQSESTNSDSEVTTGSGINDQNATADTTTDKQKVGTDPSMDKQKHKDRPVFITEPRNSTPRDAQAILEPVINDSSENKPLTEIFGRLPDTEQAKTSTRDDTNDEWEDIHETSGEKRLTQHDSLDDHDDDEERRASKDIDNIEY